MAVIVMKVDWNWGEGIARSLLDDQSKGKV